MSRPIVIYARRSEEGSRKVLFECAPPKEFAQASRSELLRYAIALAGAQKKSLAGADLSNSRLNGLCVPAGMDFTGVDLSGASLAGACFHASGLKDARLDGVRGPGIQLLEADLSGASLISAQLSGGDLAWANLRGARLNHTVLTACDFLGAHTAGADFKGARLPEVVAVDFSQALNVAPGVRTALPVPEPHRVALPLRPKQRAGDFQALHPHVPVVKALEAHLQAYEGVAKFPARDRPQNAA